MRSYEEVNKDLKELRWFFKDYEHLKHEKDKVELAKKYFEALVKADSIFLSVYNYYIVEGYSQKEICSILGVSSRFLAKIYSLLKDFLSVNL